MNDFESLFGRVQNKIYGLWIKEKITPFVVRQPKIRRDAIHRRQQLDDLSFESGENITVVFLQPIYDVVKPPAYRAFSTAVFAGQDSYPIQRDVSVMNRSVISDTKSMFVHKVSVNGRYYKMIYAQWVSLSVFFIPRP